MGYFAKIAGTIASFFQVGGTAGPGINANGAALETRNAANSAFAVHRGATPVAANDLTTKAYVDGQVGVGEVEVIRLVIGTGATQSSATLLPTTAFILDARLEVTTPYSGGTTIKLGIAGSLNLFQDTTDNTATVAGTYQVQQDTSAGAGGALVVTIAGAPGAGAGVALIIYSTPSV